MSKKTPPASQPITHTNVSLRLNTITADLMRTAASSLGLSHQAVYRLALERGLPILLAKLGKGPKP